MPCMVDIIVPVLGRPWAAAPFMASLADEPRARVVAVCESADEASQTAWFGQCATVLFGEARTFAEKVNAAYAATSSEWLLLVGDDVRFTPGWLDACLAAADDTGHVIGTNEPHSRRVRSGLHSCHPMIRRSYVDTVGASWDGPGVVCHEGYGHQFVDDEIVLAAKQRHAWRFAADAVLEHLHPVHGFGEDDATYRIGRRTAVADRRLFMERRERYA